MLSRIYHPGVGFVSGWVSLLAGFPAPIAAAALIIGNYICLIAGADPGILAKLFAAGVVICLTGAHLISVAFSGRFQWMATALKALLVAALAVCGFILPEGQPVHFLPQAGDGALIWQNGNAFIGSLVFVLFAYSGWNAACYIAGEVERPERNVPRALFTGTAIVTVLYLAVNAAMLYATPMKELAASGVDVAPVAASYIFGKSGGFITAGLISLGLISSISAMTWAGSRVSQQMGRDYPMLGMLARTDPHGIPWFAVLFQSGLALLLIFSQDVQSIITHTTFLLELMLLLTVWGVIHLRIRQKDLPRPYRAWGYPWTTLLFLIMVGFTLATLLRDRESTRWGLAILATGVLCYLFVRTPKTGPNP